MKKIHHDNLGDFIRGTAILGTGGGGDPYVGRLMLEQELAAGRSLSLIDPDYVPDDLYAISVFCMGAPTVFAEKLPNVASTIAAVRQLEKEVGRAFDAIIPLEAGGLNATLPLVVAARMGLPVVDGDGMGRAFPEVQMTTFNIYGVDATPMSAVDDHGNCVVFHTDNALRAERYSRVICVQMGGISQMGAYPITGDQIRSHAVPRTVSLAIDIGRTVREARASNQDPCETLANYFSASSPPRFSQILFDGKVSDVHRETDRGFTVGTLTLQGANAFEGQMIVMFQNEYTLAKRDGHTKAVVPDLIAVLDRETGDPITTDALCYGQRVKVLGIAAVDVMRTPRALKIIGPAAFGLSDPFQTIEECCEEGIL